MTRNSKKFTWMLTGALLLAPALGAANVHVASSPEEFQKQVRHELVMLPDYDLFDNLSFSVGDHTVTL